MSKYQHFWWSRVTWIFLDLLCKRQNYWTRVQKCHITTQTGVLFTNSDAKWSVSRKGKYKAGPYRQYYTHASISPFLHWGKNLLGVSYLATIKTISCKKNLCTVFPNFKCLLYSIRYNHYLVNIQRTIQVINFFFNIEQ